MTSALPSGTKCNGLNTNQTYQELEFTDERDLRAHYRDAHNLQCDHRGSASLTRRDNMHIERWYYDTVNNNMPTWPLSVRREVTQTTSGRRP
ncbi:uncharacterized protein FTOL_10735 [Fusarium torulosum]|uniref:Uncharacterized protein n=1 Tax=Fusarium torulosum TaxID=33205 RepID=A0AAE8SMS4_9HYPO|nr:uncharacterized protein FTOL_10735 [Fusarium torulosum]